MSAELILFLAALPFGFWAAFQDLSRMKLPNRMNIAIAVVFLVIGPLLLPIEDYLLRVGIGLAVLVSMLVLSLALHQIGGGDIKYIAVTLPWLNTEVMSIFVIILAGAVLSGFVLHRWARNQRCIRALAPRWVSWRRKRYPMGLSISAAWLVTLGLSAFSG